MEGLIGILLPSPGDRAHLPERFHANWNQEGSCYARYHYQPTSAQELTQWIEDAFQARTARSWIIQNAADMMKYNCTCKVCGVTH